MITVHKVNSKKMQMSCYVPIVDFKWIRSGYSFDPGYGAISDYAPLEVTSALREAILLMDEEAKKYDLSVDFETLVVNYGNDKLNVSIEANNRNKSWRHFA